MRKIITLAMCAILFSSGTPHAQAVSKPELVLKGFQTYVSDAKSALKSSKAKYDSDVATINATYAASVASTKSNYDEEVLAAKNLYEPQINTSIQAIKDAQAKLLSVNQVKVLKLGTFRGYWGNLDCPTNRPQCVSLDDKGNLFQVGEVTKLKAIMGERADYLYEIQLMIDLGLIEMLNAAEYQKAASVIRFEPDKIKSLNTNWEAANAAAAARRNKGLEDAKNTAAYPLSALMQEYEDDQALFESQITAGNSAIRAAKRASKNPSIFDKAFVTAYKFEYNVKWLDDVANLPFSSLNTLRSVLSQYAIIELADKASGVDSSYSYTAAEKINKSVGNVFTSDEEFKSVAKVVSAHYKKLTKITLKF